MAETRELPVKQAGAIVTVETSTDLPPNHMEGDARWVKSENKLYVSQDGTWAASAGGFVTFGGGGPATDNAVARFDGVSGSALQNSLLIVDDLGNVTGAKGISGESATLSALTASRALRTNASKQLESATTTAAELDFVSGVTSGIQTQLDNKQPLDAELTALAALATNGVIAKTGAGTVATRTVTAGSSKVSITNGDGVLGNPTVDAVEANFSLGNISGQVSNTQVATGIDAAKIADGSVSNAEFQHISTVTSNVQDQLDNKQPLDADLTAVAGLATSGIVARTGAGTAATRSVAAGSSKVSVSNGDGVSGNPTVDVVEANLTHDNIGGTLGIAKGGTGQTTQTAAYDALSPNTTKGDITVYNGTDNVRLPVGTNGQVIKANSGTATGLEWDTDLSGGGGGMTIAYITGNTTAANNTKYLANTTGGAFTLTLPTGSSGVQIAAVDDAETWDINNLTIAPATGQKIDGLAINETLVCDVRRGWVTLSWDNTNSRWVMESSFAGTGGLALQRINSNTTLGAGKNFLCDTSSGAFTATLPVGAVGSVIRVTDANDTWDTNNLTVAPATGQTIDGQAANETLICDVKRGWVEFSWDPTGSKWVVSTLSSAANLIPTLKSATFTAEAGRKYLCDTSGGAFTATLPAGSGQAVIEFIDSARTWNGTNLTITPASGQIIDGLTANESLVCDIIGGWVELSWNGTKWVLKSTASIQVSEVSQTGAGLVKSAGQLKGTNTNDSASAGYVGEVLTATPSSAVSVKDAETVVASVTLTAGDWELWGNVRLSSSGSSTSSETVNIVGISTTSAIVDPHFTGYYYKAWAHVQARFAAPLRYLTVPNGSTQVANLIVNALGVASPPTTITISTDTILYARRRR